MNRERVIYLDILRILACVSVIVLHVAYYQWNNLSIVSNSYGWLVSNSFCAISKFGVPLFFMISGATFLNPEKEISKKQIFTKYILRIVGLIVLWNILYFLFQYYIIGEQSLGILLTGYSHMWYMYALIGLYVFIPILRQISKEIGIVKYYVVIFAFVMLVNGLLSITSYYEVTEINILNKVFSSFMLNGFLYPIGYSLLGYFLTKIKLNRRLVCILSVLGACAIFAAIILSYQYGIWKQKDSRLLFYDVNTLSVFLNTIGIFVFIRYFFDSKAFSVKFKRGVVFLSENTLGIYLLHAMILEVMKMKGLILDTINPVFGIIFYSIICFVLAFGGSVLIKKIPYVGKRGV